MDSTTPSFGTLFGPLARVADCIDHDGIECVGGADLYDLVTAARAAKASEVVIGVFVDPTEPTVARERAFVKLVSRIAGAIPTSASVTLAA